MLIVCPLVRPLDRNVCFVSRSFAVAAFFGGGHGTETVMVKKFILMPHSLLVAG